MAKQNQTQTSDVYATADVDQDQEAMVATDADQKTVVDMQGAMSADEHHGQGGLYEIRQGRRVLIERTSE